METKSELRKRILEYRDGLDAMDREYLDSRLCSRILETKEVKEASTIMLYASYKSEADTFRIMDILWEQEKKIALPKVVGEDMVFYIIKDKNDLIPGYKDIPEPKDGLEIYEPIGFSVMVVPGVCFDKMLFRIGYGKGFYDRYLSKHKSVHSIGMAYDFQVVDAIPIDPWDRGLDMIVTEKRTIKF